MHRIKIHPKAVKTLKSMEKAILRRVAVAIDELSEKGLGAGSVKALSGVPNGYRKRVGRWRIIFTLVKIQDEIHIWIIEMEKDMKKDYARWIQYIIDRL